MADTRQFIELDEIVKLYLDRSEQGIHKYYKCWHIGFSGMEQLGLDFFFRIKTAKLPVNANLTVTIPADYLNYTKAGVLNAKGEIIPLNYNNTLTTYADLVPNRLEKTQDDTLLTGFFINNPVWFNYWTDNGCVNLYGLPSGSPFVGSFKIDDANGVILLDESFGYDYLMLEYLSSPDPIEGGDYRVPMQFKEALIAYISWQDIAHVPSKTHVNNANVAFRKSNFYNERKNAVARYKPIRIAEMYQANLEMQRITVKT